MPVSVSKDVAFRDSDCFVTEEIYNHCEVWERILRGFHKRDEFLTYILPGLCAVKIVFADGLHAQGFEQTAGEKFCCFIHCRFLLDICVE